MLHIVKMDRNPLGSEATMDYLNQFLEGGNLDPALRQVLVQGGTGLEHFYFLLKDEEIIGYCGMLLHADMDGLGGPCITSLFIKEEFRGRHYCQLLINHVTHQAQVLGYDSAYIHVGDQDFCPSQSWKKVKDYAIQSRHGKVYRRELGQAI